MRFPRSLGAITCVLLAVSALSLGTAWRLQTSAAQKLEAAKFVQDRSVPEVDTETPTPALNRAILGNLAKATDVRSAIDAALRKLSGSVRKIDEQQAAAETVAGASRQRLQALATVLETALRPARASHAALGDVAGHLSTSQQLAHLIRMELRRLDRKLGPPLS